MIDIGGKIKRRRIKLGLTQEELAARTELSKGFISQLERNLTSPSIATLGDILEALGTNLSDFFSEQTEEKVVFGADDVFVKEDAEAGHAIHWLIPNAQKNSLEPILVTLVPGGRTWEDDPHEGEEFGWRAALCFGLANAASVCGAVPASASSLRACTLLKTRAKRKRVCFGFPHRRAFKRGFIGIIT